MGTGPNLFHKLVPSMTDKRFSQTEEELRILKKKFELKKITHQEFKDRLKGLRFKDDHGKYWTIGVQSGDWYSFDGSSWNKSNPPSLQAGKAICIYCGFENDLNNESCAHCDGHMDSDAQRCQECGTRLRDDSLECPFCSNKHKFQERENDGSEDALETENGTEFVFRSLSPLSFLLFWGVMGMICGTLFGAYVGVARSYSGAIDIFPKFLEALQGKILGGIVFGLTGGIIGFALLAFSSFLLAVLINFILSLLGGIKLRISKFG